MFQNLIIGIEFISLIILPMLIFGARLADVAIKTLRIIFIHQGK